MAEAIDVPTFVLMAAQLIFHKTAINAKTGAACLYAFMLFRK